MISGTKKKVAVCSCILDVTVKLTQDTGDTQIRQFTFKIHVYIQRQQFLLSYTSSWTRTNIPMFILRFWTTVLSTDYRPSIWFTQNV